MFIHNFRAKFSNMGLRAVGANLSTIKTAKYAYLWKVYLTFHTREKSGALVFESAGTAPLWNGCLILIHNELLGSGFQCEPWMFCTPWKSGCLHLEWSSTCIPRFENPSCMSSKQGSCLYFHIFFTPPVGWMIFPRWLDERYSHSDFFFPF